MQQKIALRPESIKDVPIMTKKAMLKNAPTQRLRPTIGADTQAILRAARSVVFDTKETQARCDAAAKIAYEKAQLT